MIISHQFCHALGQTRRANQTKVSGRGIWGVKKIRAVVCDGGGNSISGESATEHAAWGTSSGLQSE